MNFCPAFSPPLICTLHDVVASSSRVARIIWSCSPYRHSIHLPSGKPAPPRSYVVDQDVAPLFHVVSPISTAFRSGGPAVAPADVKYIGAATWAAHDRGMSARRIEDAGISGGQTIRSSVAFAIEPAISTANSNGIFTRDFITCPIRSPRNASALSVGLK